MGAFESPGRRPPLRRLPLRCTVNEAVLAAPDASERGPRLFELGSPLTTHVLAVHCGRERPRVRIVFPNGELASGVLTRSAHEGLRLHSDRAIRQGECQLELSLERIMFVIRTRLDGDELREPRWFTFDRRTAMRMPLAPGVATLEWSVPHGSRVIGEVIDLTPNGVLCALPAESSPPPMHVPFSAEVTAANQRITCVAEPCRLRREGNTRYLGLRLQSTAQHHALADLYLAHRHASLRPRHTASPQALVQMLRRSGYLALREANPPSLAWCGLRLPAESSCDFVYVAREGALLGHLSVTRVYADTWLFHQLATLSEHEETTACRRELYALGCSAPLAYSGSRAHGLAYFDLGKRWHRLFFEDFTRWVDDTREACVTRLDRFERSDDVAPQASLVDGYHAAPATSSDLVGATTMARAQLPKLFADALDLSPRSLRQLALCGPERATLYRRSREVFVLRDAEGIAAVALCELGSPELSLFDILNMAFVFVCLRRRPCSASQRLLLAQVRTFYAEHGVRNPLIVAPHGTLAAESEPGTRLVETMGAITMTASALRQYESFTRIHFSHQLSRSQAATQDVRPCP